MQHFTATHSDHEKCSLLSVSSPHNTDLRIKSMRYRITTSSTVNYDKRARQSSKHLKSTKSCSFKKILTLSPSSPSWRWGGLYTQHLSGVYWPGRTRLFQCFSTAADAIGNTLLLSQLHYCYSFQHCHLPLLWNSSVYLGTANLFSWVQGSF